MFQLPTSYAYAGSSGAGAAFVAVNRSVVPTAIAFPSPLPLSEPPQAASTGASRPITAGSTKVLRFMLEFLQSCSGPCSRHAGVSQRITGVGAKVLATRLVRTCRAVGGHGS